MPWFAFASDSQKDSASVMEILCAYVRNRSKNSKGDSLPIDIQSIMSWIASTGPSGGRIDLRQSRLVGADLRDANLRHALLEDADLRNAKMDHGSLADANLAGADCRNINLRFADLRRANVVATNFEGAHLRFANFSSANIFGANFNSSTIIGTNFSECTGAVVQQFDGAISDESTRLPYFTAAV